MDLRDVTEFIKDSIGYIITFLVIAFVLIFLVGFNPVAGNSMSPTLKEGNVLLMDKLIFKFNDLKREDIVVLEKNNKSYIKRVIGLPGEEIHYLQNKLYINGEVYNEDYLSSSVKTHNFLFVDICSKEDCPDGKIPDNMYLVLGDNREESVDSRDSSVGLIAKKEIKGKALFRVWPLNSFGTIK